VDAGGLGALEEAGADLEMAFGIGQVKGVDLGIGTGPGEVQGGAAVEGAELEDPTRGGRPGDATDVEEFERGDIPVAEGNLQGDDHLIDSRDERGGGAGWDVGASMNPAIVEAGPSLKVAEAVASGAEGITDRVASKLYGGGKDLGEGRHRKRDW